MKARASPESASALVAAPAAVLQADRMTKSAELEGLAISDAEQVTVFLLRRLLARR